MLSFFYHVVFLIFTIYVLIRSVAYGLYETNEQENKFGGRLVIFFTIFIFTIFIFILFQNNLRTSLYLI